MSSKVCHNSHVIPCWPLSILSIRFGYSHSVEICCLRWSTAAAADNKPQVQKLMRWKDSQGDPKIIS